jgi:dihydroorotase
MLGSAVSRRWQEARSAHQERIKAGRGAGCHNAAMSPSTLSLTRPDDWHLHLRDGDALRAVLPHTARQFARAIVMPNLKPPVTTAALALDYKRRILAALPAGSDFEPLMTLYLTDRTPPDEMRRAREAGIVACKLYPAGATTHSDAGVTDIRKTYATLEAMQREGLLLLVHGEVTDSDIDLFDREAVFIERVLQPLRRDFPGLKIVFEHITTREAAQYVAAGDDHLAATITAHHLLFNRNAIFLGGLRPHYYCLPVLKREEHRLALVAAATSGSPKFFLGTDSAPHASVLKEHAAACAGCYTALSALELYAQAFDAAGALHRLEGFASFHGADFYGLPRNSGRVTLQRQPWALPESLAFGAQQLKPLCGGETLNWKFQTAT